MSGQIPISMASPTDSASKDPANIDTALPTADATACGPARLDTPPTQQQREAESAPSSEVQIPATIPDEKLAGGPPTSVSADPADQRKGSLRSVEASDPSDSSRRSSAGSLRFETPRLAGLPQGISRGIDGHRIRNASPPPAKFRAHVAFDTVSPDISKNSGITLSAKHNGFHAQRRSKTFMVGVDENKYSELALEWLLTSMVDDHDTIVCVRVVEKDVKPSHGAAYKEQAHKLLQKVIMANKLDKAVCLILEYQFGRLGSTFDTLVSVHLPSMLVVGTKGKSNQGMQGMWNTRHSFSKYCLEKSSVPVVVVRPEDLPGKKKDKRARDPSRNAYAQMLSATNGVHESDLMDDKLLLSTVTQLSSADEASQVAKALCLPAEFDPTVKGIGRGGVSAAHVPPSIVIGHAPERSDEDHAGGVDGEDGDEGKLADGAGDHHDASDNYDDDDDDNDDDDNDDNDDDNDDDNGDDDQGAPPSPAPDPVKMEMLHEMEVGEASALKKRNTGDHLSGDDDDGKK